MAEQREGINVSVSTLQDYLQALMGRIGLLALDDDQIAMLKLDFKKIRRPLLVIGPPATGKTEGTIAAIEKANRSLPESKQFGFKKIQLGQLVVGDLTGIPVVVSEGNVRRVLTDDLPQNDPTKPDYQEHGVLFLDEITTVDEAQMQPALGLADGSRSIGTYKLPEHWLVVAAGNGPESSNFMRLDDVMLTRFRTFNVLPDYKYWRKYAESIDIVEEILAFLDFNNDAFYREITTDMDQVGKAHAASRTWEMLSDEIKKYTAPINELTGLSAEHMKLLQQTLNWDIWDYDNILQVADGCIGTQTAREFAAFMRFREKVSYDPKKILAGTEKEPDLDMAEEVFHIIMERCVRQLKEDLKDKGKASKVDGGDWNYPKECFEETANFINWLMHFETTSYDKCLQAFVMARGSSEDIVNILVNSAFESYCPSYSAFLERNYEYFIENQIS